MAEMNLWLKTFSKLHVDRSKGIAPHKPILLLAVLELVERGVIDDGTVQLDSDLLFTYRSWWDLLAADRPFSITLPFFHMRSEPFWELVPRDGHKDVLAHRRQMRSVRELREHVECARLDPTLFALMRDRKGNARLTRVLRDAYFGERAQKVRKRHALVRKELDLETDILASASGPFELDWRGRAATARRNPLFRQFVLHTYDRTCCVCRLRIAGGSDGELLDAAHIVPYAVYSNDDVRNGLCLCKNHHWAFDRGLIAVDDDYHIMVSSFLDERRPTEWRLTELEGKMIRLPSFSEQVLPAKEALAWYRKNPFQE